MGGSEPHVMFDELGNSLNRCAWESPFFKDESCHFCPYVFVGVEVNGTIFARFPGFWFSNVMEQARKGKDFSLFFVQGFVEYRMGNCAGVGILYDG